MTVKIPAYVTTEKIRNALRRRFGPPEHAFFDEVANATGFAVRRHTDCLSIGIWPSRGMLLQGFEVKATRSDWLHEKKKPAKAEESIFGHCDRWWLVAAEGAVLPEEIPEWWGHMELHGSKLVTLKAAPELAPRPLSRGALAAILRKVPETTISKEAYEEEKKTLREVLRAEVVASAKADNEYAKYQYDDLVKRVASFEEASGVPLHGDRACWPFHDPKAVGAALKTLLELRSVQKFVDNTREQLGWMKERAEKIAEDIGMRLKEIA